MRLTTEALIIRENNNIGEADRFVTALTRELGVVRASARGARNLKSRNASATQLLSYSRLSLYKGREKYIIDDAQPIQVFFDLRSDLEKLALAQYFCELAGLLAPQEEPAEDILRLMLNALHFSAAAGGSPDRSRRCWSCGCWPTPVLCRISPPAPSAAAMTARPCGSICRAGC